MLVNNNVGGCLWEVRFQTLKYSRRSLQVTLLPPISFSTSRSGARRSGTSLASSLLKSSSMSETHDHEHFGPVYFIYNLILIWFWVHVPVSWPFSRPSKYGLVATLRPGWGSRKQPMLEKQEWMCFLTFCNSSCWFCFTWISIQPDAHSESVL